MAAVRVSAMSMAMYLMQIHNGDAYSKFLRVLIASKLYVCCCCCYGNVVKEQYVYFKGDTARSDLEQRLLEIDSTETCTAVNEFSMDDPPDQEDANL